MAKTERVPKAAKLSTSPPGEWTPRIPHGLDELVARGLLHPPTRQWTQADSIPPTLSEHLPLTSEEILELDRGA